MGLFNGYLKPGPGVSKDAPKKKGVFLYLELLARKFSKLIGLNALHFACSIPMILIYFFMFSYISAYLTLAIGASDPNLSPDDLAVFQFSITTILTTFSVIFMGTGPASAAAAYIMRCFTREQHAWIFSDFKDKYKENFKQGLIITVIDFIVLALSFIAIYVYYIQHLRTGGIIYFIAMLFVTLFLIVYIFAHSYIYQLMVTFENRTFTNIKNSMILALSTMPYNIIASVVIFIACYYIIILTNIINPLLSVLFAMIFLIMFFRFPLEFHAARVIQRNLLNNLENETDDNNKNEDTESAK